MTIGRRLESAFNIYWDIKSLVQISILLNKSKIVEIWTKFFISRAIMKAQKRQTTFWKWQDKGNFVIIISRNSLLKLGWQINAANYIKIKTTFKSSCILSCFVWHPVYKQYYNPTFYLQSLLSFILQYVPKFTQHFSSQV